MKADFHLAASWSRLYINLDQESTIGEMLQSRHLGWLSHPRAYVPCMSLRDETVYGERIGDVLPGLRAFIGAAVYDDRGGFESCAFNVD